MLDYEILDESLASLAAAGPDLRNGMTNHAPMAIEAMCALGRGDAVIPWLERYRPGMLPWPAASGRIEPADWRAALGRSERVSAWRALFADELEEAPWRQVLDRWTLRLAPGICAAATHGVIRVGHAVRALALEQTRPRMQELADGLASWAATYQVLPTDLSTRRPTLRPNDAITRVEVVPPAQRRFAGTITSSLEALALFPQFAGVIGLVNLDGEPAAVISGLTETFARVYLANAHDFLTSIVFVHGVTSIVALRSLAPHLSQETAREALRYAWQAGCGLYATFGQRPLPQRDLENPHESAQTLVDMAIANGDEHAIKFTEACLREHAFNPSPAYLVAARHAVETLRG